MLTESSVNSKWVLEETNYGAEIGKSMILLKEAGVSIQNDREWVSFSRDDPAEVLFQKIMDTINYIQKTKSSPIGPILGGAISCARLAERLQRTKRFAKRLARLVHSQCMLIRHFATV